MDKLGDYFCFSNIAVYFFEQNSLVKKHLRTILFVIVSFTIGFTILYFLYDKFNADYIEQCKQDGIPLTQYPLWDKLISDFKSVNVFWIVIMLLTYTLSNVSRTLRWNMLFNSIGYKPKFYNTFFAVMITYFVNLFIPRMGEVARAAAMKKAEDIPIEKSMGTIVVDRITVSYTHLTLPTTPYV